MTTHDNILSYASQRFKNYTIVWGNYSVKLITDNEQIVFTDSQNSKSVFMFYNMIKSDIGGEIRPYNRHLKYFDFRGLSIGETIPECYCVDINSAYLSALKNENIITEKTFNNINKLTTSKAKKINRLKAVGMFAKNDLKIEYSDNRPINIEPVQNPLAWVFFTACEATFKAMKTVKKSQKEDYLLYWVDGIFLRDNPEKAVEILAGFGFESKIEKINNLTVTEKTISYEKDGEKKILFIPKKPEIADYKKEILKSIRK